MVRPISHGDLGVLNVRYKALACLIRLFLETAVNPEFRWNIYHSQLFQYHILEETVLPDPGFPPYYPPEFFAVIKKITIETPLNISTMSTSQWYRVIVEENLTMLIVQDSTRIYTPCKIELANPNVDF